MGTFLVRVFGKIKMRLDKAREYFCAIRPQIMDPEKYTVQNIAKDLYAGFIVAIISFPLAMALAIASGVSPERGLLPRLLLGHSHLFLVDASSRLVDLRALLL